MRPSKTQLAALARYFRASFVGHLGWEIAQLPLYTIFHNESPAGIAYAVAHCTTGDLLIGGSTLLVALLLTAADAWPAQHHRRVAVLTVVLGLSYTLFSEWFNTTVRHAWAYTDGMPLLPVLRVGLTPVLQWLVVPTAAFQIAGAHARSGE